MVFEFAIEPELVATWGAISNYRYFYEKFGIGQPRMMAEYPKLQNWRRKVLQAASGKDDMELTRVIEIVKMLSEKMISRKTDGYDGEIEWLENAEREDSILPFHAILALSNPRKHPSVLNAQMLGVSNHSQWHINKQLPDVPREASEMAKAVRPLLHNCHTAVFIDPYFMLGDNWQKWQRPFREFIQELPMERYDSTQLRVEFHSSADVKNAPSAEFFKQRCMEKLAEHIPNGLSICFKRWKQKPEGKKLHDRFLITDIGGVDFSTGLDEGLYGETQKISLLEQNAYKTIWECYMSTEPAFNLAEDEFTILDGKILR
jgi:hypothetical protein